MTLPRGLLGAGLVFWGWQSGQLLVGIGLALLVEAPRWTTLRFELRGSDFARISDLAAVVFLALAALLAATRGMSEGVLATMQWLPIVLAPVLLAQLVSTAGRLPLSALFRTLRRRKVRALLVCAPEEAPADPPAGLLVLHPGEIDRGLARLQ